MEKVYMLLSGGVDSTVLLYDLIHQGRTVRPCWVYYGQRHAVETSKAELTCKRLHAEGRIPGYNGIDLESLFLNFAQASSLEGNQNAGALLGQVEVPDGHYEADSMKLTVVPNRNMIFASVVTGLAVARGYDSLALAVHAGDHAIYPDCRPEFWEHLGAAIYAGNHIRVWTPYIRMSKADIVRRGSELQVPFQDTWSCYKGVMPNHCGTCGTCTERREAFQLAGVYDPTQYTA